MLQNTTLFSVTTSDAANLLSKGTSLREDLHEKVTADASKARDDSYERQSPVAKIGPLEVEIQKGVADTEHIDCHRGFKKKGSPQRRRS